MSKLNIVKYLNICQLNPIEATWQSNVNRNANWPKKLWDGQAKRGEGEKSGSGRQFFGQEVDFVPKLEILVSFS